MLGPRGQSENQRSLKTNWIYFGSIPIDCGLSDLDRVRYRSVGRGTKLRLLKYPLWERGGKKKTKIFKGAKREEQLRKGSLPYGVLWCTYGVLIPMCRDTLASLLGVCTWGHCRIFTS